MSYQSRSQVFEFLKQEIIGPKVSDKKLDLCTQPVFFSSREASVGPWICAETGQEILPIKPRDRYGSGVLEPVKSKEEQTPNPSETFGEEDLVNNPDVSTGEIDNLADKSPASTDEARDSLDLEVKSNRAWLNPRSLGASFFIETQPNGKLELTIRGGTYRPLTVVVAENQKPVDTNPDTQVEGASKQREYTWYLREEFQQIFELTESNFSFTEDRKLFKPIILVIITK